MRKRVTDRGRESVCVSLSLTATPHFCLPIRDVWYHPSPRDGGKRGERQSSIRSNPPSRGTKHYTEAPWNILSVSPDPTPKEAGGYAHVWLTDHNSSPHPTHMHIPCIFLPVRKAGCYPARTKQKQEPRYVWNLRFGNRQDRGAVFPQGAGTHARGDADPWQPSSGDSSRYGPQLQIAAGFDMADEPVAFCQPMPSHRSRQIIRFGKPFSNATLSYLFCCCFRFTLLFFFLSRPTSSLRHHPAEQQAWSNQDHVMVFSSYEW